MTRKKIKEMVKGITNFCWIFSFLAFLFVVLATLIPMISGYQITEEGNALEMPPLVIEDFQQRTNSQMNNNSIREFHEIKRIEGTLI